MHCVRFKVGYVSFPRGSDNKESAWNAGDLGSIPGLARSPGGEHGTRSSILALRIPIDRGARWITVHRVANGRTWLNNQAYMWVSDYLIVLYFVLFVLWELALFWNKVLGGSLWYKRNKINTVLDEIGRRTYIHPFLWFQCSFAATRSDFSQASNQNQLIFKHPFILYSVFPTLLPSEFPCNDLPLRIYFLMSKNEVSHANRNKW